MRKIGGYAFQDCTELEEITLNRGLTEIGVGIFKGCGKLTGTMILPDSVTTIRQDAFADSSLSGVHVGGGLTILESGAFPDSIRLTTIVQRYGNYCLKIQAVRTRLCLYGMEHAMFPPECIHMWRGVLLLPAA